MLIISLPLSANIQEDSVGFWIIWWIWLSCDRSTLWNSCTYRHRQGKQFVPCLKKQSLRKTIPYLWFSCFWVVLNDNFGRLVWSRTDHCQRHSLQMKMASAAALGIRRLLAIWMPCSCLRNHDQALLSTFWVGWVVQISIVVPMLVCGRVGGLSSIHFINIGFDSNFIVCVRWKVFASEWSHGRFEQILAATILNRRTGKLCYFHFVRAVPQHMPASSVIWPSGAACICCGFGQNFGQELSMNLRLRRWQNC